jgi:adenylate cyclase
VQPRGKKSGSEPHAEPPGSRRLSWEELARSAGVNDERLRDLAALGVIRPGEGDPPFRSGDVLRVRAVAALEASGVALEEIGEAISAGELSFGYLDYVAQPPPVLEQTHADLCSELGIPFAALERVYLAFGLPPPLDDERVREDDAAIHRGIRLLLDSIDEADVLHSARVFGDGLRRIAEYQVHLFHTRVEEQFRRAGVPEALVLDVALREVGVRTTPLGEQFAAWLYRRHSETFTVEHRVLHGEADLERAGIRRKAPADPAAIAFLDISGYTRLTEELGDEASAAMPMRLAVLVQEAAARHDGRTLKWIGDGVELYFRRPTDAVVCALDLCEQIPEIDIPGAHVGINAGPLVYENGDFYGRTVNIAARIAAHATLGQVLVSETVASRAAGASVVFALLGPVAFKGVSEDVVVYEARRA